MLNYRISKKMYELINDMFCISKCLIDDKQVILCLHKWKNIFLVYFEKFHKALRNNFGLPNKF
jgi:hypothetical protein